MADETIPHEDEVEGVIRDELDGGEGDANVVIADLAALTGGESPTEAEHNALRASHNAVLAALRKSGIIPTA